MVNAIPGADDANAMSEKTLMYPSGTPPPRSEYKPCALCGWGPARGIHSPIISGPRKGEPWGHAYVERKD